MALSTEWLSEVKNFFPYISFVAGLGGSLHCVGMCGGLVTASCDQNKDVVRYQFGRLLGYLSLGLLAGSLSGLLNLKSIHPLISLLPSLTIGALFIFWGTQNFLGKRAELPTPKFMGKFYTHLWKKLVQRNENLSKAFFTGLISIFLPCGLLYGVALGTLALQHSYEAVFSMFFFWLGTVPSMVIAPGIVRKILKPLKAALPKTYAVSLILIGVLTISFRLTNMHMAKASTSQSEAKAHSCH